ncbi:hypothetical protein NDU88_002211 [Pleurodeles waltl]|uniref:Uncharacterized protein n=1 Tax=Pleurodeles waltl TaxID=8319 RepID=A0AAV7KRH9_PLEWA|nr:hypothetical protein NDU88_002211 [Pleurodeles waltl]
MLNSFRSYANAGSRPLLPTPHLQKGQNLLWGAPMRCRWADQEMTSPRDPVVLPFRPLTLRGPRAEVQQPATHDQSTGPGSPQPEL